MPRFRVLTKAIEKARRAQLTAEESHWVFEDAADTLNEIIKICNMGGKNYLTESEQSMARKFELIDDLLISRGYHT